jgi:hypothetical protein
MVDPFGKDRPVVANNIDEFGKSFIRSGMGRSCCGVFAGDQQEIPMLPQHRRRIFQEGVDPIIGTKI